MGLVHLVGAGPGDPGLITVRGRDALRNAQVVIHDSLVSRRLLDLAPTHAERIFVGKRKGKAATPQSDINAMLVAKARRGLRVVRLKGGDPFVFGRGAEEAEFLRAAGIPFRVVPGVTAAAGVGAYAGIPLTHRADASAVTLVTGHIDPDSPRNALDWPALARSPGTLVVYMGLAHLEAICGTLATHGKARETPAAVVEQGSRPSQRVISGTLETIAALVRQAELGSPALFILGQVVNRREALSWFEKLPLFGQRIVVTRPEGEADTCAADLEALGAEVLLAPTVEIRPLDDLAMLERTIEQLNRYEWLVFTSRNGVNFFFGHLLATGRDVRSVGHMKIAAIGPTTATALANYHLIADIVPRAFSSEGLAEALEPCVSGRTVLLARADRGRAELVDSLQSICRLEQVAAYQHRDAAALPPEIVERMATDQVDWVTLTSPAIAERLHALLPEPLRLRIGSAIRLATISPLTTSAANKLGWSVAAVAADPTWEGLVEAICQACDRAMKSHA